MADTKWTIKGREFVNCNCSYGCPCQFNGLPTYGHCQAVAGFEIERGHHGSTKLDGLRFVSILRWPGAIHEGKGEAAVVIDERATEAQGTALLRIDMVGGFEYTLAEIGRGWSKTSRPIRLELSDSYSQFAEIHLCQSGIVH